MAFSIRLTKTKAEYFSVSVWTTAGLAWHFRKYSKDEKLQALEDQARAEKVGLWKDNNPIPSWDWRRGVRE